MTTALCQPKPRKRRVSRYSRLPLDARLLVRTLEILFPTWRYAEDNKHTSRVMRAAMRILQPGSEQGIKAGSKPGVYYIKSESRPKLNRWYVCNTKDLTCEVDTARIVLPPNVQIREEVFFCEDFRRTGMCYHLLCAAIAEAVRVDSLEFPREED